MGAPLFRPDAVRAPAHHWIGGEAVAGGAAPLAVLRPSDGRIHATLAEADAAMVDRAVAAARAAAGPWAAMKPRQRGRLMRTWADLIEDHRDEIARLEAVVSSRPVDEAATIDLATAAEYLRFYAEWCDKLEGSVTASGEDAVSLVLREPYGLVAVITPWNFPLILSTWKIAPAIAAGNTVVLKPSELTPFSMVRLAELAVEAGIPPGVVNVVHGTGAVVGPLLTCHPGVAYVTFTGSTAVGGRIMADVGRTGLKPVALELGGKSPVLVFDDAEDLDSVADHVTWGITRNAGQLCYAGSRLVVQEGVAAALVDRIAARMQRLHRGPTWEEGVEMPPIISRPQAERIDRLVRQTCAEGATCHLGGGMVEEGGGIWYHPTILTGVTEAMAGYREEIFGPVLAVQTFTAEAEGIARAQHPVYGLTASVFTGNGTRALRVARALRAGTVWVNRWGRTAEMMTSPFGGYGGSGFGKEAGRQGIENFTRQKAVWIDIGAETVLGHQVAPDGSRLR